MTIQKHGVLELWTKQEQSSDDHDHEYEEGWQHSELTDLGRKKINNVFFVESRGALLINQDGIFVTIDLRSKEKILVHHKVEETGYGKNPYACWFLLNESCSSTCCRGRHVGSRCRTTPPVLYEIDWVF